MNLGSGDADVCSAFTVPAKTFHHLDCDSFNRMKVSLDSDTSQSIIDSSSFQAATAFFAFSVVLPRVVEELLSLSHKALAVGCAQYIWDIDFPAQNSYGDVEVIIFLPNGEVVKRGIPKKTIKSPRVSDVVQPIASRLGFRLEKRVNFGDCGLFLKLIKEPCG
ncbi:MAG: hypothetical protein KKB51_06395 [Candidatus Riflebacteria bacterium]|nr:hypothetical protein [Candidatus Riflebacteria bacterium]